MEPHLILFDCDGTLVDSHGHIVRVMQLTFRTCGMVPPSAASVREVIGLSLHEAVSRLLPEDARGCTQAIVASYRQHYGRIPDESRLYDGVRETLLALREDGYRLGIVTGKSQRGLMSALEQHRLHDLFCVWRTADHCPSKPHPAMVLECMQESGVRAMRTTVVGDSRFDMQMARLGGVRALGVTFGVASAEVLLEAGAHAVIHTFPALRAYFAPCATAAGRTR